MCGRVTLALDIDTVRDLLRTEFVIKDMRVEPHEYKPRYNISPGQKVLAVINDGMNNRAGKFHWGWVPSWSKDENIGFSLINARAETLSEKPAFRSSYYKKRCVIVVDGFYEWDRKGKEKIPYHFKLKEKQLISIAGLWSTYVKKDGSKLYSCAIVTTEANELMSKIHNRMPVILSKMDEKVWLDPVITDKVCLDAVLNSFPADGMEAFEVSRIVNNVKNESIECIIPIKKLA